MTDPTPGVKPGRLLCWCVLLASGMIYGSSFSWMKIAVTGGAHPLGMVFWFAVIATIVLAAEMAVRRRFLPIDLRFL